MGDHDRCRWTIRRRRSAPSTCPARRWSCRTPGTPGRRSCSPRSASRPSPRRARGSRRRSVGPTARCPATKRSPTPPTSPRPPRCPSTPTSRTASPTTRLASRRRSPRRPRPGTAGASVEDYDRTAIHPIGLAAERVAAAVEAARPHGVVITGRAENLIRGVPRPRRHDRPAAGVPGGRRRRAVRARPVHDRRRPRSVVTSVDRPVNVLLLPGGPSVGELAAAGVARVSVGGTLAWVSWGAVAAAAAGAAVDRHARATATSPRRAGRRPGGADELVTQWRRCRCRSPAAPGAPTGAAR